MYLNQVCKRSKLKKMKFLSTDHSGGGRYFTGLDELQSEIDILSSLDHEHIVKLKEVVVDEEDDTLCIVTKLARLGALMTPTSTYSYHYNQNIRALLLSEEGIDVLRDISIQIVQVRRYIYFCLSEPHIPAGHRAYSSPRHLPPRHQA